MKKTAVVLAVVIGLGTAAFAFGPGGGPFGGHYKDGMFKVVKKLDLTKDQIKQLDVIKDAQSKERKAKRKEFRKNKKGMMKSMKPELGAFMTANSFDKDGFKSQMNQKIEEKRKMIEEKIGTILDKKADTMEKIFNILTPEQRTKWIQLSKEQ